VAAEVLAERDDALLAAYVEGSGFSVREQLRSLVAQARIHPVVFGSAITGAGVDELRSAIAGLLPAAGGDPDGPVAATVFKVDRGPAGEKVAYVRMFAGTIRVRERLGDAKVTAVAVFADGTSVARPATSATSPRWC
jgi:ribosomal protection tetracycline resistance protein